MNCTLLSFLLVVPTSLLAAQAPNKLQDPRVNSPVAVGKPQAVTAPAIDQGNAWFPEVRKNLGTYFEHETARGTYVFANPKDEAITWKHLAGSCQCSKAVIRVGGRTYELSKGAAGTPLHRVDGDDRVPVTQIEVGPREAGEVEVFMEINGIAGTRSASVDIHTDDPDTPQMKLTYSATGAQMFILSPKDINLNEMVWNEEREFTVTVTSPVAKDFEIVSMEDAGKDFTVSYTKEQTDGGARWTIQGKYKPSSSDAGGGVLKFITDVRGNASFLVRVSALIKGPLEVKPGTFLTMGMIRQGKSKLASVTLVPNDGTDLKADSITFERLSVDPKFVVARQRKDGKNLVIDLEVSPEAPRGLLRGDMVLHLNHPAIKRKKILFNGYVR